MSRLPAVVIDPALRYDGPIPRAERKAAVHWAILPALKRRMR